MKYMHRDNFRHLTGHGRDVALGVDTMLERLNVASDGAVTKWLRLFDNFENYRSGPTVSIHMHIDVATNQLRAKFTNVMPGAEHGISQDDFNLHMNRYGAASTRLVSVSSLLNGHLETVTAPLPALLRTAPSISNSYQIYLHSFNRSETGEEIPNSKYIGLTKRGWRTRWAEHVRAANSGSHYRFHQALQRFNGTTSVNHAVMSYGLSETEALKMEEQMVGYESLYPLGLNMIPGGNAGLTYLRRIGAIGHGERIRPDDVQNVVNRFFERASRKGLPNPLAAANWLNADYAEKVICAGDDRLKPQQIRDARYLASLGQDAETVARQIDARNVAQVKRLLSGETYSRIA